MLQKEILSVCVCACVCASVRACVCVCVCLSTDELWKCLYSLGWWVQASLHSDWWIHCRLHDHPHGDCTTYRYVSVGERKITLVLFPDWCHNCSLVHQARSSSRGNRTPGSHCNPGCDSP